MLERITKDSSALFTLEETAQELRQMEKHITDSQTLGCLRDGFEYAFELIADKLNDKIKELGCK